MSVLDKLEVLKLNNKHEPTRIESPRVVFGDLSGWLTNRRGDLLLDKNGHPQRKMLAYNIDFAQNDDGSYNFDSPTTFELVDWEKWVKLPLRSFDLYVPTALAKIRVPRVVFVRFNDYMPKKTHSLNVNSVYDAYDGICAYSKRKLKRSEANMDHYIPRDKGGPTTWENIRLSDIKINSMKGNRYNHEVGLPSVPPIIPKEIPMINFLKNEKKVPEWDLFLKKAK